MTYTEYQNQRFLAFIVEVKQRGSLPNSVEGYVMYTDGEAAKTEADDGGRRVDDISCIRESPDNSFQLPAMLVWEGILAVTTSSDGYDVSGYGTWRKATAAEVIAVAQCRNPFDPVPPSPLSPSDSAHGACGGDPDEQAVPRDPMGMTDEEAAGELADQDEKDEVL